jgi:site-specific DNA-methyltransferase (adenine-specific)
MDRELSVANRANGTPESYNDQYYPTNIIDMANLRSSTNIHPTQKPVELLEYLIKTYTNENDVVLDPTAGSFTTAVACINTNRRCIAIEMDTINNYFNAGIARCHAAITELNVNVVQ